MPEEQGQKYLVVFQPSGRRGHIEAGQSVKQASRVLGVDIEGICGDVGTCGTCKVRIEDGPFEKYGVVSHRNHLSPITEAEKIVINPQMERQGYRLACQARVDGDVVVFVPEGSRMGKQIVRKAARDIAIEPAIRPAVRPTVGPAIQAAVQRRAIATGVFEPERVGQLERAGRRESHR